MNNQSKNGWRKYTKQEIIIRLKLLYEQKGTSFTYREYVAGKYKPALNTIKDQFGSWENALKESGIPLPRDTKQVIYTDEKIIEILKDFYERYEIMASADYYRELKIRPSITIINKRFGSWSNAVKEAGLQVNIKRYSDDELLKCLTQAKNDIGNLTVSKYDSWAKKNKKPNSRTLRNRFGTWNKALQKANILINQTHTK